MPAMPHSRAGEVVLGVDTHKDFHVAAIVTTQSKFVASERFPTTAEGYRQLLAWARRHGDVRRAGVECTGSYGAALTRLLLEEGVVVLEVNQGDRAERRRRGKSDAVDAEAAACAVLSGRARATAKTGDGEVEVLRLLRIAKTSAVKARSQAINQLKAILVRGEPELREALTGLSNPALIRRCADLEQGIPANPDGAARYALRLLARRITSLTAEITDLNAGIEAAIRRRSPHLLERYGVGPDTASVLLLTAGDNSDRMTSEAAFAALCGVSPVEASSGKTQRRRLNRGGDRAANCALYTIVLARLRWDQRTQDYVHRRVSEGLTRREAIRCLKRYVAREIYRDITATAATAQATHHQLAA
jgi:transposase